MLPVRHVLLGQHGTIDGWRKGWCRRYTAEDGDRFSMVSSVLEKNVILDTDDENLILVTSYYYN